MNRAIALFLALAVLLAHALALHKSISGELAPPYEYAHVAYRLGRNLAQTGRMAWDTSLVGQECYPSLAWVGVCALAERLYFSVTHFSQAVGVVCALLTVLCVAQFSPGRLAGVIAPVLLVFSGGLAAAAVSGTEIPLLAFLVTLTFLAFERRWRVTLALAASGTCLVRAEGAIFVAALLVLELGGRLRGDEETRARPVLASFLAPLVCCGALGLVRWSTTGWLLSPAMENALRPSTAALARGSRRLLDFLLGSGAPWLVIFPLWYLARRHLKGPGRRALFLTLVWAAAVTASGGGILPFSGEMTPILPILFLSVQQAMTHALDSPRPGLPQLSWGLFLLGLLSSAMASKYPGDLGPLPAESVHRAWMTPSTPPYVGQVGARGRLGLDEEIKRTERLRAMGLFLRDQLDPTYTVLTPWPGAVGYLSQLAVIDMVGRTTRLGQQRVRPWNGLARTDVVAALAKRPDYIIPILGAGGRLPDPNGIARAWMEWMDRDAAQPGREQEIVSELRSYEMLAAPLVYEKRAPTTDATLFYLLRRRDLGLAPSLQVALSGRRFRIFASHQAHEQLADLSLQVRSRSGLLAMRPTGEWVPDPSVLARTRLLLFPTGTRRILLVEGRLPEGIESGELRAVLRNPRATREHAFANASAGVVESF